jgi:hypothetical protein
MRSRNPRDAVLRERWLAILRAELASREDVDNDDVGDAREVLYRKLDEMGERLRMAPGYVAPTPEQTALAVQELERFFAGRRR